MERCNLSLKVEPFPTVLQLVKYCSSTSTRTALAAALRPSLLFVFADSGLPLAPLLQRLCCSLGLAHIDMDKLAVSAAPGVVAAASGAVKVKVSQASLSAAVTCPALIDKVAELQKEGKNLSPKLLPSNCWLEAFKLKKQ